jgi:hypothetical protein
MDEYVNTINPTAQYISPVPLSKPIVEYVEKANYLKRSLPFGIAPMHIEVDENDATLPPAPRDNLDTNPTCTSCKTYKNPYKKGDCYMLYNPDQNMWGKVCGVKNIDWVRGNRFGSAYHKEKLWNNTEYRVEPPAIRRRNPDMVVPTSDYPNLDYFNQAFNEYKDYPYFDKKECGLPTYTYPYDLTDPQARSVITEGFTNGSYNVYIVVVLLLLILLFIFKRKL